MTALLLTIPDNKISNQTITYTYDKGGNMTARTYYELTVEDELENPLSGLSLAYEDDKLIGLSDGSVTIPYDSIGNPTQYTDFVNAPSQLQWQGRQLAGAAAHLNMFGQPTPGTASYRYDSNGLRTHKTVEFGMMGSEEMQVDYEYIWEGTLLLGYNMGINSGSEDGNSIAMRIIYGDDGESLGYTYKDATGEGDTVWYIKNMFGDTQGLYSAKNRQMEVIYTYDAWGTPTMEAANQTDPLSGLYLLMYLLTNQLTYRGYYYDFETGRYYLQSRYYAPSWGRFLNADKHFDTQSSALGANRYLYCDNNPITYTDPKGEATNKKLKFTAYKIYFKVTPKGTSATLRMYNDLSGESLKLEKDSNGKAKKETIVRGYYKENYYVKCGEEYYFVKRKDVIPQKILANGTYFVRNAATGWYMDDHDYNGKDKNPVNQIVYKGNTAQQWKITYDSKDGYCTISPVCASEYRLSLSSSFGADQNNYNAFIYKKNDANIQQKWLIITWGTDGYRLVTKKSVENNSPKGLEVPNSIIKDNPQQKAQLQIWTMCNEKRQKWSVIYTPEKLKDEQMKADCEALLKTEKYNKTAWDSADLLKKRTMLTQLLADVQTILGTKINKTINFIEMEYNTIKNTKGEIIGATGTVGAYNYSTNQISMNTKCLNDGILSKEVRSTLIHEARHGYQHEAVDNKNSHTVGSNTKSKWKSNFENYITSNKSGYHEQAVEWDAFSFAGQAKPALSGLTPVYSGSWPNQY